MGAGFDQSGMGGPMGAGFGQPGMGGPMGAGFGQPGMGGPMGADFGQPGMGGQMPFGYPQMGPSPQVMGAQDFEAPEMGMPYGGGQMPSMQQQFPAQGGLPVGAGGDCGCGGPQPQAVPQYNFVPPTPPIYSAPYTGPTNVAQPPFMNPYGMGPMDGMMRYDDESNEYDF
jgi:morphogenetic protein associated with SpoVID